MGTTNAAEWKESPAGGKLPELPILAFLGQGWPVRVEEGLPFELNAGDPLLRRPQSSALWKRRMAIVSRLTAMPAMAAI